MMIPEPRQSYEPLDAGDGYTGDRTVRVGLRLRASEAEAIDNAAAAAEVTRSRFIREAALREAERTEP